MLKVIRFEALSDYRLRVELSNGKEGIFDMKPYLHMPIFQPLSDPALFARVKPCFGGGLAWPNEADISADTIEADLQLINKRVA